MKCSYLTLSQYLDGELEPVVTGEVDAHLVGCERCHTALDMMRSEAKRIRQLVHIHATDDVVRQLFVELGLQEGDVPLPARKVTKAKLTQNEVLPWLRAESSGAALPWSPESPMNQQPMDEVAKPSNMVPSSELEDDSRFTAFSNQHGDPSSLPVPSSSPSLTEEGSHAAALSNPAEGEPPIDLQGNPRGEDVARVSSSEDSGTAVRQTQSEPISEWGALHLHDSSAFSAPADLLGQEHHEASPSPWRPPVIAAKPPVLEDGPTTVSPRPSTDNLLAQGHTMHPDSPLGGESDTEKKTAFLGMDEDDDAGVVLLRPGLKDQILFRLQSLMPRISRTKDEDAIETVHGIGAPQERVHSAARKLLQQGSSVAGLAVSQVERAMTNFHIARAKNMLEEIEDTSIDALQMGEVVQEQKRKVTKDVMLESQGDQHEVPSIQTKHGTTLVDSNATVTPPSLEGRHAHAVAAHRKSRHAEDKEHHNVGVMLDSLWSSRTPARMLQFIGGGVVIVVLAATVALAHRGPMTRTAHPAITGHHTLSKSAPTAVHPSSTPTPHSSQQIALTNVQTIGTSTQPVQIQDLRYGQHTGYYRVVFDLTGSTEPQVTLGTDTTTGDVIVVIKDAQPLSQPAPLSETTTITSVHMIPPSSGINETVFEFSVAKPVTLRPAYLLSPTRLIVDFIPQ